jgi:hypothetical protein
MPSIAYRCQIALGGFFTGWRVPGGYAAAAHAFPPLTQPAMFQRLRKLKEELGIRLFERVGKGRGPPHRRERTVRMRAEVPRVHAR